jgi:phosphoglycerate dehydrogenase-like enzyme
MTRVLLTHTPQARQQYYGERSLRGLRAAAQVLLREGTDALDAAGLIHAARDVEIVVADRLTEGPAQIFAALPKLRAFVRCAVDIRNVDVAAASVAGVLVTRAGPSFVQSVAELGIRQQAAVAWLVHKCRGHGAVQPHDRAGFELRLPSTRQQCLIDLFPGPGPDDGRGAATMPSLARARCFSDLDVR